MNRAERRKLSRDMRRAGNKTMVVAFPCPACAEPLRLTGDATGLKRIEHSDPSCADAADASAGGRAAYLERVRAALAVANTEAAANAEKAATT